MDFKKNVSRGTFFFYLERILASEKRAENSGHKNFVEPWLGQSLGRGWYGFAIQIFSVLLALRETVEKTHSVDLAMLVVF